MEKKQTYINADDFGITKKNTDEILNLIKEGNINSVSVMINQYDFKANELLSLNAKIKLHLNLTTSFTPGSKKDIKNLINSSFIKLLFTLDKNKKSEIFKEIDYQVEAFKNKMNIKSISLDSHHHVHMIPWIYNYLILSKHNIVEIRNSLEGFNSFQLKHLVLLKVLRNIIALVVLNFLKIFHNKNKNIKLINFCGLIYSGIIDKEKFLFQYRYLNKKNNLSEIALHPGKIGNNETAYFNLRDKKELNSKKRDTEYRVGLLKLTNDT